MCVHRGVDIAGSAGERVATPVNGTVRFAGLVPAEDGRVGAVTVEQGDGTRVTLMPLDEMRVTRGVTVSTGDGVGTLSADGDLSTSSPHVHVSLRRGETYLDPMTVLASPPSANSSDARSSARSPEPSADALSGRSSTGVTPVSSGAAGVAADARAVTRSSGITPLHEPAPAAEVSQKTAAPSAAACDALAASPSRGISQLRSAASPRAESAARSATQGFGVLGQVLRAAVPAAVKWASALLLATLAGLGLLWPVWRRDSSAGPRDVIAGGEDVAAAVVR
ncbi:MAG: M23 family metallopeptidase [Coriobacteriales bacterium]|nr:M23 family metallopeptidase [Coriobacteriales bacterium]